MSIDMNSVKPEASPGSDISLPNQNGENTTATVLTMVINKVTGKLTRVYGHEPSEPCRLCDERNSCTKPAYSDCRIFCG